MITASRLKNITLTLIVIISVSFYNLLFISGTIERISSLLASVIVVILFVIHIIYFNKDEADSVRQIFKVPVILILLTPLLSMIVAKSFHGQSYPLSLYAHSPMYLYLLYFLLHRWKVSADFVYKLIVILGITYITIYFIQWIIFPTTILNTRVRIERGTLRVFLDGSICAFLTFYLFLSKIVTGSFNWKNILVVFLIFSVLAILQGTRGSLVFMVALSGLYLLSGKHINNRLGILFTALIIAVCIFFIFKDIFIELYKLSIEQQSEGEENPRWRANKFFLTDFMPSFLAYIFGNGADHMLSPYGQKVMYYKTYYGLYQSDVGLVGAYSKYGILLVIGYLSILIRLIFYKLPKKLNVWRYFFLGEIMAIFYGSGSYTTAQGAVSLVLVLYLTDQLLFKEELEQINETAGTRISHLENNDNAYGIKK